MKLIIQWLFTFSNLFNSQILDSQYFLFLIDHISSLLYYFFKITNFSIVILKIYEIND